MFVIVTTYRAKPGEEDAIIALHEHWARTLKAGGILSGELLRGNRDERLFVAIVRFQSEELARALADDPVQDAVVYRLASLTESQPIHLACHVEWRTPRNEER